MSEMNPSSTTTSQSLLMNAFNTWKTTQLQLEVAVNAFCDACSGLEAVTNESNTEIGELYDEVLREVELSATKLDSHRQQLALADLAMSRIRETSHRVPSINTLPPEIFSRILSFAAGGSRCKIQVIEDAEDHDALGPLETLQLVCALWRNAVLASPSLWSHVDVMMNSYESQDDHRLSNNTFLQIQRAASTPLHLHFGYSLGQDIGTRTVDSLRSYLPRVSAITFESDASPEVALHVYKALSQVRVPSVGGLCELVYLQLGNQKTIDLRDLLTMLSCNPSLRLLRLENVPLPSETTLAPSFMVHLPNLEVLDIMSGTQYHYLLSRLELGDTKLDLRINISARESLAALQGFAQRCIIKSLTFHLDYYSTPSLEDLQSCISSAPHLRALFIKCSSQFLKSDIAHSLFLAKVSPLLPQISMSDSPTAWRPIFPHLKTLGITVLDQNSAHDILQLLDSVITSYSLDLVVIGEDRSVTEPFVNYELREWALKRGKLATIQKYSDLCGEEIVWDFFMDRVMRMYAHN